MKKYMFDTNIFNHIIDNKISIDFSKGRNEYFVTHIQEDEIKNTPSDKRRNELLNIFHSIKQTETLTESSVYGISKYGGGKYGGGEIFHKIRDELNKDKPRRVESNTRDALIAEVCLINNFILVTDEEKLSNIVKRMQGKVVTLDEFQKEQK